MLKAYKYRLEPTSAQRDKLDWTLRRCRELYNAGLEERRTAYKKCGVSVSYHQQAVSLPLVKQGRPEYKDIHSQVLQDVLKRLDKAFQSFFRRVKAGQTPGYPRFQGRNRFDSFTYPQYKANVPDDARHVYLPKVGNVRIRLHRPIEGRIKTCTVRRDRCGDWWICFSCEVEPKPLPATGEVVGLDFGLHSIVATSDGEHFQAPKYLRESERRLRKAQRRLARREKGSKRREKARLLVAKIHRKIARQRADYIHKLTRYLVNRYDGIAHEDLNLLGLSKGMLAKSFHDAAIGMVVHQLSYKAENAGRERVPFNPTYSSQECSACGERQKMPLHKRTYVCKACGLIEDRDVNAAKVGKKRTWGRPDPSGTNVVVDNTCVA